MAERRTAGGKPKTLRLNDDVAARLRAYCRFHDVSEAKAAERLLDYALSQAGYTPEPVPAGHLTRLREGL